MLVDIGSIVYHGRYGKGEVIKISGDKIYVAFGKLQRIFSYPEAFEKGYLTLKRKESIKKEKTPDEKVKHETELGMPRDTGETVNTDLFERLKKDIVHEAVVIKRVKQGGCSIQDTESNRIVRVQEHKHKYKCTCDRKESRYIFDKIKDDYANCMGFEYKVMSKSSGQEYRVLCLELYEDTKTFILTVINEYFSY